MAKKVMIVEDNELNMKLFRDLVEVSGHNTLLAYSGLKVLEMARDENPNLILLDIQLPGLSGLDIISQLKRDRALKVIPIIVVTAFAMKGDEERICQTGCEEYMSKPISITHFLASMKKWLYR